jgi:hypothetical protein
MDNPVISNRKRLSMQLGGLSFLLGSILFLITGQILTFAVIVFGIGLGFFIGSELDKRKPGTTSHVKTGEPAKNGSVLTANFRKTFLSDSLPIRFFSLLIAGALILIISWYIGYYLLPEGVVTTGAPAGEAAAPNVLLETTVIVGYNLLVMLVIVAIGVLLPQYPFAYLIPLVWCGFYGILLGTNSFVLPMAERMAPSLAVFERAGPIEMAAYLLAAAAAYSPLRSRITRIKEAIKAPLSRSQYIGIGIAVLMILAAAYREAQMILAAS